MRIDIEYLNYNGINLRLRVAGIYASLNHIKVGKLKFQAKRKGQKKNIDNKT